MLMWENEGTNMRISCYVDYELLASCRVKRVVSVSDQSILLLISGRRTSWQALCRVPFHILQSCTPVPVL